MTYFAWLGGSWAKWMPRTVPARDTEVFVWATERGCPTVSSNTDALKVSAKCPRGSSKTRGSKRKAPGTRKAVVCMISSDSGSTACLG